MFNPVKAIPEVYKVVKQFNGIIAGGAVADKYFGVESSDIDVFVSENGNKDKLFKIIEKYDFTLAQSKLQELFRPQFNGYDVPQFDEYGILSFNRSDRGIKAVYKGEIKGYPVDIVIVSTENVIRYIDTFDLNIKRAYYDGRYHYTREFLRDAETGVVTPHNFEPLGYIRAKKYADKYGLAVHPIFELSRNYVAYIKKYRHDEYIPKKYREYVEETDFGSFEEHKVQALDLLRFVNAHEVYKQKRMDNLLLLSYFMNKEIQSRHRLINEKLTIKIDSYRFHEYESATSRLFFGASEEEKALLGPICFITKEQFRENKILDLFGRQTSIIKYINKIEKKLPQYKMTFKLLRHYVENREMSEEITIEFSSRTEDLLQISTNKGWKSCQSWTFGYANRLNSCTLGNLGGATLVGIIRINGNTDWDGRFLVRLGKNNKVWLEKIYTHRMEISRNMDSIHHQIIEALEKKGYCAMCNTKRDEDFESYKILFKPYNDTNIELNRYGNGWQFKNTCYKSDVVENLVLLEDIDDVLDIL